MQGYQSSSHVIRRVYGCAPISQLSNFNSNIWAGKKHGHPADSVSTNSSLDLRVKREKFVQLTHRAQFKDTGGCSRKGVLKRVEGAKSDPWYYTVHFGCVFGGKGYASKATGQ